ncbi:MAG: gamma carbonic anhydrase family protein [Bacillota bacterium]
MIHAVNGNEPQIEQEVFIAEGSKIIGDVYIKSGASIWFNTIVRGDLGPIKIGKKTNIQENSTLHIDKGTPLIVGDNVTVGHNAVLHGCTVNNNCIIGMGAVILNNANVGKNSIIGAGALVPEGKEIPEGSLVLGVPAKITRKLNEKEIKSIQESADHYYELSQKYINEK